ncbi:hypothetical protein Q8F55_007797 [Vanrija albida]|uniref:DUF1742-domain-containing protein n=1 Tax=Vanrija albida TaxID=181172 RepID=A0ABR3PUK7_9TREE
MATPIQNIYYERKTATARACYICHRPTQTVLATLKAEDYLYTCDGHLGDVGFATALASPAPGPSADDIRKVVAEYGAREARKAEKKDGEDKDKDKDKASAFSLGGIASGIAGGVGAVASGVGSAVGLTGGDEKDEAKAPTPPITANIPSSSAPSHKKYALHRSIFEARRADLIRKQQTARAKEVSKGLPQVPRGSF